MKRLCDTPCHSVVKRVSIRVYKRKPFCLCLKICNQWQNLTENPYFCTLNN
ncbi:hypothetical protein FR991_03060 [Bacteroides fragilis]|uniref:Uncharacterized protein n=2 Tax=Bacteroides fragilis TaxID=817 RepID=Q64Y88_BACFR|nr:hypothetical protein F3B28_08870 [Bacteroides fragilis]BAD47538.1 hypothetical protein BF0787 [Bacteroides fragilis YCH46]KAA4710484.1 hypothetical protein F3B27_02700 [Bacteroides fragilis]KAA4722620.1 hypothetical protein F3B32_00945 [Bacteroides fragilis]KAA4730467.1 hypothetical protein F3B30_08590 [Bacteroides fragilis]